DNEPKTVDPKAALREKIEAKELAIPTKIANFTLPLLGIGRPVVLGEKLPPSILSLLAPAISSYNCGLRYENKTGRREL
ncbi:hypothetical protein V6N12_034377, partial [Hibiscus sabdariffa]